MARPRKSLPELIEADLDPTELEAANAHRTPLGQLSTDVALQFGDGQPYARERLISETRFFMAHSAEAMLEAGRRLIQIKENEPHGEFMEIVEERLGLRERAAQKMMQASLKYLSPRLASKAPALAGLGKTKLLELMFEDDEALESLSQGGSVAGLKLDDIDRMTSRELAAALREAREALTAKDKVLDAKNEKLDKLDADLARPFKPKRGSPARTAEDAAALNELNESVNAIDIPFDRLCVVATELTTHDSPPMRERATQAVAYLLMRMREVVTACQLDVDSSDEALGLRPEWLNAKN